MAVNSTGVLGVAWMAGRPAVPCHELWFTASMDGGRSFLPPERLSVPACPSAVWSTSGDYFGLASSSTGQFHVLWGEPGAVGGVLVHTTVDVRKSAPASVPRLER
jgi:hypothetical protein